MQLQQQAREFYVRDPRDHLNGILPAEYAVGWMGEPVVYRREGNYGTPFYMFKPRHRHAIGDIIRVRDTGVVYVITECKDGWWKLEWPD